MRSAKVAISRGQDVNIDVTIYTADTLVGGVLTESTTAANISGHTYVLTVSRRPNSSDKLITKTLSTLVAASGTARATILAADSSSLDPGTYYFDVRRTNSGYVEPVVGGPFIISGNAWLPA